VKGVKPTNWRGGIRPSLVTISVIRNQYDILFWYRLTWRKCKCRRGIRYIDAFTGVSGVKQAWLK
jgi:hypothetical protein